VAFETKDVLHREESLLNFEDLGILEAEGKIEPLQLSEAFKISEEDEDQEAPLIDLGVL